MRCNSASTTRTYCALRRIFDAEQLLDRQRVAQVVAERRQVIHAVGQRRRLLSSSSTSAVFSMPVCR